MFKLLRSTLFILFISVYLSKGIFAQNRYKVVDPEVSFFAGTPLEDIDAKSDKLVGVLDIEKNTFAFRMAMNTFKFKRELMQEHYNENYLETDKYPNSEFRGTISGDFDLESDGEYPVKATGVFKVHNVEKTYSIDALIQVKSGKPSIDAKFMIELEDHNIDRPSVVMMKIAEEAEVSVHAELEKL